MRSINFQSICFQVCISFSISIFHNLSFVLVLFKLYCIISVMTSTRTFAKLFLYGS